MYCAFIRNAAVSSKTDFQIDGAPLQFVCLFGCLLVLFCFVFLLFVFVFVLFVCLFF